MKKSNLLEVKGVTTRCRRHLVAEHVTSPTVSERSFSTPSSEDADPDLDQREAT